MWPHRAEFEHGVDMRAAARQTPSKTRHRGCRSPRAATACRRRTSRSFDRCPEGARQLTAAASISGSRDAPDHDKEAPLELGPVVRHGREHRNLRRRRGGAHRHRHSRPAARHPRSHGRRRTTQCSRRRRSPAQARLGAWRTRATPRCMRQSSYRLRSPLPQGQVRPVPVTSIASAKGTRTSSENNPP